MLNYFIHLIFFAPSGFVEAILPCSPILAAFNKYNVLIYYRNDGFENKTQAELIHSLVSNQIQTITALFSSYILHSHS